jgi:P2-related tail formation protein
MTSAADLLPSGSSILEHALAEAGADHLPVPVREALDPDEAPANLLPFLAAHESVDLWYSDWPDERKRQMIREAPELATLKGSRAAAARFLPYVDAHIVHKVSHPARDPVGRIAAGITPIQHKDLVARFLLKVPLTAPAHAVCVGRTAVGRAAVRTINREPLRRAMQALVVSKGPYTEYSVTFAHRTTITLDDGIDLDAGQALGAFKDRIRL